MLRRLTDDMERGEFFVVSTCVNATAQGTCRIYVALLFDLLDFVLGDLESRSSDNVMQCNLGRAYDI